MLEKTFWAILLILNFYGAIIADSKLQRFIVGIGLVCSAIKLATLH